MAVQFKVNNLAFVSRSLQAAGGQIMADGIKELTALGQLVERDIESRAPSSMRNISRTPGWTRFRTRQNPRLVYVVPVLKGVHGRGPKRRSNFAREMLRDAMIPGLEAKRPEVNRRFEAVVANVCQRFNSG